MDKCGKEFVFISQQQASFHLFGTVDLLFISLLRLLRLKHSFPWSSLLLICWAPHWTRTAAALICFGARSSIVLTVLLFSLRVSRHSCASLTVSRTIRAQAISFSFFAARQEEVVVCAFTCKIEPIFFFHLHVFSTVTRSMKKIRLNAQKVGNGQVTGKSTTTELWTTKVKFYLHEIVWLERNSSNVNFY